MKKFALLLLLCGAMAAAQNSSPAPAAEKPKMPMFSASDLAAKVPDAKAEDVQSMDAILRAIYAAISGPAGDRDWNRFRSLFLPQVRFTQTSPAPNGGGTEVMAWSEEEFIHDASEVFSKEPFYENAIVNKADVYGNIAQVFSSYESRRKPGEKPFQRGINSIQLLNDGKRWWVLSILWDAEREGNPLPPKFARK